MTFGDFQDHINAIIEKAGNNISATFSYDEENGKYLAACSDGTTITSFPSGKKITVLFGSGHQAMATI